MLSPNMVCYLIFTSQKLQVTIGPFLGNINTSTCFCWVCSGLADWNSIIWCFDFDKLFATVAWHWLCHGVMIFDLNRITHKQNLTAAKWQSVYPWAQLVHVTDQNKPKSHVWNIDDFYWLRGGLKSPSWMSAQLDPIWLNPTSLWLLSQAVGTLMLVNNGRCT